MSDKTCRPNDLPRRLNWVQPSHLPTHAFPGDRLLHSDYCCASHHWSPSQEQVRHWGFSGFLLYNAALPNVPSSDYSCGQDIQAKEAVRCWSLPGLILHNPTLPNLPCPDDSLQTQEVYSVKCLGLEARCPNPRDYASCLQGDLPLRNLLYTISANVYHNPSCS